MASPSSKGVVRVARILAPTDFSPYAESALIWAAELGKAFKAEVVVLHVLDLTFGALAGSPAEVAAMQAFSDLADKARREAKELMSDVAKRYPDARTMIREGSPRPIIQQVAEEEGADLIVMGTQGRTGVAHLLFGSVAEHVVRHSRVPVLIVRQSELPPQS